MPKDRYGWFGIWSDTKKRTYGSYNTKEEKEKYLKEVLYFTGDFEQPEEAFKYLKDKLEYYNNLVNCCERSGIPNLSVLKEARDAFAVMYDTSKVFMPREN